MEYIFIYEKVFQFDLGLAFGSGVMGLVVLLDLRSLAVECLRKTAVRIKMQSIYPSLDLEHAVLQKSDKGQVFIDQVRPALGSVGWLSPCPKKPQNCPISDFFILTPKYFLPYCLILTWNRLLLTQYHQVPNSTWPSTITYQPVPPYTDPLPPRTNQDRPILTHFHQVPTNTAPY